MTEMQKAAMVIAHAALMNAEMELMRAENRERELRGESPAHGPEQWSKFIRKWDFRLGYNALVSLFHD